MAVLGRLCQNLIFSNRFLFTMFVFLNLAKILKFVKTFHETWGGWLKLLHWASLFSTPPLLQWPFWIYEPWAVYLNFKFFIQHLFKSLHYALSSPGSRSARPGWCPDGQWTRWWNDGQPDGPHGWTDGPRGDSATGWVGTLVMLNLILGNMKIYLNLYFLSFLSIQIVVLLEILHHGRQGPVYFA